MKLAPSLFLLACAVAPAASPAAPTKTARNIIDHYEARTNSKR